LELELMASIPPLTEARLAQAFQILAERDPDLRRILHDCGAPPLWSRPPGFPTLIYTILEQQVSLESAAACYKKLVAATSPLTPQNFLKLEDAALKTIGFSRQKTAYCRGLAQTILEGKLDLEALETLGDEEVRSTLVKIKGIGHWTADNYLLLALLRPDVYPAGDLALVIAVQLVKNLPTRPNLQEMEAIGEAWRPWRAVATRMLWQFYLNRKGKA
jgi:DNA-3-methyladenine glycosylase II